MKKTEKDIDKEYSELCARLGDIEVKKGALEFQRNEIIKKLGALAREKVEIQGDVQ